MFNKAFSRNKTFSLEIPFFLPADQTRNTVPQKNLLKSQETFELIKWNADNIFKQPGIILQFPSNN